MHDSLFEPLRFGALEAKNRIWMAPLTRGRSTQPGSVPNEMMATYYRQRASAGLIISEATGISVEGLGWPAAPGARDPPKPACLSCKHVASVLYHP